MSMKQAGNCHARRIATAMLAVAGLALPANGDTKPTYDKRIEEAAIRMLVPKLGEIRGSLGIGADDYLAPMINEQVVDRRPAVSPPQPFENPPFPESRKAMQGPQDAPGAPTADNGLQVTQAPQASEDKAPEQAAPSDERRRKGSFLFF
jgi:hypothetical protein